MWVTISFDAGGDRPRRPDHPQEHGAGRARRAAAAIVADDEADQRRRSEQRRFGERRWSDGEWARDDDDHGHRGGAPQGARPADGTLVYMFGFNSGEKESILRFHVLKSALLLVPGNIPSTFSNCISYRFS